MWNDFRSLSILRERSVAYHRIIQRYRPVTEGQCAPAESLDGAPMSKFRLSEWVVPPVAIPLFVLLLICGAAILNR